MCHTIVCLIKVVSLTSTIVTKVTIRSNNKNGGMEYLDRKTRIVCKCLSKKMKLTFLGMESGILTLNRVSLNICLLH